MDGITRLYQGRGGTCDFLRTACSESEWMHGVNEAWRGSGAETIILRKFLQSGLLVTDPGLADVFVVPYFSASDCRLSGNRWRCLSSGKAQELFAHLKHYGPSTRHRHLFLATGDIHSQPLVIQAQTLLLSWGAKSHAGTVGHIIMPPAIVDPLLQPSAWEEEGFDRRERDILFWVTGSPNNALRIEIFNQLEMFKISHEIRRYPGETGSTVVHWAGRRVTQEESTMPPRAQLVSEMRRAQLCPVVPAENAFNKRLFDVVLAGCLPVVVAHYTLFGSGVSWWHMNGSPVEWVMPFPDLIDWRRLAIEVPAEKFEEEIYMSYATAILGVSHAEREAKRRYMREVRGLLSYNLQGLGASGAPGTPPDAFDAILGEVRRVLTACSAGPSGTVCTFFPRALGVRTVAPAAINTDQDVRKQKEWTYSGPEVSCQPAVRWRDPDVGIALGAGAWPQAVIERYVTRVVAPSEGGLRGVAVRSLESRVRDGLIAVEDLADSLFAHCHLSSTPSACHDTIAQGPDGVVSLHLCSIQKVASLQMVAALREEDGPNVCRLLPRPVFIPPPAQAARKGPLIEFVAHVCRFDDQPAEDSFFRTMGEHLGGFHFKGALAGAEFQVRS